MREVANVVQLLVKTLKCGLSELPLILNTMLLYILGLQHGNPKHCSNYAVLGTLRDQQTDWLQQLLPFYFLESI